MAVGSYAVDLQNNYMKKSNVGELSLTTYTW